MGTAVAGRLTDCGWDVTTWSRSGRTLGGLPDSPDPAQVVAGATYVVLCLYDGDACRSTVQRLTDGLTSGNVVVNLSTVGPDEAEELDNLVTKTGAGYVHAPVIGSVGPAADGRLTVLAGTRDAGDPAAPLLRDLGEPVAIGDPASAAAAKLVANAALAGSLLTIGDAVTTARELRLPVPTAYDVLERSPVGGLVAAKRGRLDGGDLGHADFTTAALRKDVALVADSAAGARLLARLDRALGTADDADHDVAALAQPSSRPETEGEHRLSIAAGVDVPDSVLAPLVAYAAGHATGDTAHFRRAFLPTAHVEGLRDGRFVSWDLEDYCANFTGLPAADESSRSRRIEHVAVTGTVGTATMTLQHRPDTFTDVFLLVRDDGRWWIANKAYHRDRA